MENDGFPRFVSINLTKLEAWMCCYRNYVYLEDSVVGWVRDTSFFPVILVGNGRVGCPDN